MNFSWKSQGPGNNSLKEIAGIKTAAVCVSDDGVGLTKEDTCDVFEVFKRQATAKGAAGTGLGLAIVKEIRTARRHRLGRIQGEKRRDLLHVRFKEPGGMIAGVCLSRG